VPRKTQSFQRISRDRDKAGAAKILLISQSPGDAPYAADARRKIYFQAFGTGTAKGAVIRKHDVATVLADHPAVGENGHGVEFFPDHAVGTTMFFLHHHRWPT
jgi:hypothetical protein